MEIQNANTTKSKSKRLRNINTVQWTEGPSSLDQGKLTISDPKVIAFVVNAAVDNIYTPYNRIEHSDRIHHISDTI